MCGVYGYYGDYGYSAGVGPAKAIALIREHGCIEEIIKQGKVIVNGCG